MKMTRSGPLRPCRTHYRGSETPPTRQMARTVASGAKLGLVFELYRTYSCQATALRRASACCRATASPPSPTSLLGWPRTGPARRPAPVLTEPHFRSGPPSPVYRLKLPVVREVLQPGPHPRGKGRHESWLRSLLSGWRTVRQPCNVDAVPRTARGFLLSRVKGHIFQLRI